MDNRHEDAPEGKPGGEGGSDKPVERQSEDSQAKAVDPTPAGSGSDDLAERDEPREGQSRTVKPTKLGAYPEGPPRTVKLTDVGAYREIRKPRAKGTFLQESGVRIFKWMLWLTAFVLAALFAYLIWETARVPDSIPRASSDSASVARDTVMARLLLAQHQAVFSNFAAGIEKIVIAFLLPLLTAILGYLFGTQADTTSREGSGNKDTGEV